MSDGNKFKSIFFLLTSLEGIVKPFIVVFKYLSPKPLTYTLLEPSCLDTPEIFVIAPAASLTPFSANSCAPILSFITVAFFCSNNKALFFSLLVVVFTTISSNATPSSADIS